MPVVGSNLRELNGRLKEQIASNQFGNTNNTRGDLRALGTLITNFIAAFDVVENPPKPKAEPKGTNFDKERDTKKRGEMTDQPV